MRIDYEYLKDILEVFLDSEIPTVDWNDFSSFHGEDDHKFVFHIEIMVDKGLIKSTAKSGGIGIGRSSHDYMVSIIDWRLTSERDKGSSLLYNL